MCWTAACNAVSKGNKIITNPEYSVVAIPGLTITTGINEVDINTVLGFR